MMKSNLRRMTVPSCRLYMLVVLMMAFAACSAGAGNGPNSPSGVTSESGGNQTTMWRIQFTQSGGFAGMQRELAVTSAGEATAKDLRRNREVKVRLDDGEVTRLRTLLAQAPESAAASGLGSQCRDCFEYAVDATVDGQRIAARVVDTQLDASGFRPLVNALVDILTRTLASTQG
jgi:hypothetical protein